MNEEATGFRNFAEFYGFYLGEHAAPACRRLHVVGTGLVLAWAGLAVARDARFALLMPVTGYGFAWLGHLLFERNRPATFHHPGWSLIADFRLFGETVTGRRPW